MTLACYGALEIVGVIIIIIPIGRYDIFMMLPVDVLLIHRWICRTVEMYHAMTSEGRLCLAGFHCLQPQLSTPSSVSWLPLLRHTTMNIHFRIIFAGQQQLRRVHSV